MRSISPFESFWGVAHHAALGPSEGKVHDGALPGHLGGERAHFVECKVGHKADAAFGRPAQPFSRNGGHQFGFGATCADMAYNRLFPEVHGIRVKKVAIGGKANFTLRQAYDFCPTRLLF